MALLGSSFSAFASAETIWMSNGDRLTGEIKQIDANTLSLQTSYGLMALNWEQVQRIEGSIAVALKDEVTRAAYLSRLSPQGESPSPEILVQADPLPAVDKPVGSGGLFDKSNWEGSLDLGLNYKTASTRSEDYSATANTVFKQASWRHHIYGNYLRRTDDGETVAHVLGVSLASDRFLTDRFFWQVRARYKRDHTEEVSRQIGLGTGPGYQLWDDETGAFSISGLMGRLRYDYTDSPSEGFFGASLRWNYKRYFLDSKRMELYTTGELTRPLDGSSDLNLDSVVGLRYKMTDWLSWFVSYSRNQINGGRQDLSEKRISTGLGVVW